ncbi:phosphopantetheine-binding protein [Halarcobacter ebronensis]|uniref:Acyl carrier protein n=1 Tax=Halarcobacter ebronensis TaxID=1462615 RepID=A0A4Q1ATG1_9BACT|nr:phosphopantetheine-binding protein [Halarcobacter ebronensis]QKF83502.1 acyl carrier protein [Halarcobacter ebronensis]RXK08296.1 acyl carrier protein [Halarcobacter ebronensis]
MKMDINSFKQILIEGLNLEDTTPEDIENDSTLFGDEGLGLDSVDSIELVLIIEKEYGVKINNPAEYNTIFASVNNLFKYINDNK